jgi:type III secretory pathway component EscS
MKSIEARNFFLWMSMGGFLLSLIYTITALHTQTLGLYIFSILQFVISLLMFVYYEKLGEIDEEVKTD